MTTPRLTLPGIPNWVWVVGIAIALLAAVYAGTQIAPLLERAEPVSKVQDVTAPEAPVARPVPPAPANGPSFSAEGPRPVGVSQDRMTPSNNCVVRTGMRFCESKAGGNWLYAPLP